MNKIQKFFIFFILVISVATVAYKVGDSRGYEAGYNEGYRYDCKDEIAVIYKRLKAQTKTMDSMNDVVRRTMVENDQLKNSERYRKGRENYYRDRAKADSVRAKFVSDSIKYHKVAMRYEDSLANLTGFRGIVRADGSADSAICALWSDDLGNLAECKPGWHVSHVKRGKGKR